MYVDKILERLEKKSLSQIGCRKPHTCVHTLSWAKVSVVLQVYKPKENFSYKYRTYLYCLKEKYL